MATSAQRRLKTEHTRRFSSDSEHFEIPDLTTIQTASYEAFLQEDAEKRKEDGLESVLQEIFPLSLIHI